MEFVQAIMLFINVVLVLLITIKMRKFLSLQRHYMQIEKNIEAMVQENSQIVDLILEELENKLQETQEAKQELSRLVQAAAGCTGSACVPGVGQAGEASVTRTDSSEEKEEYPFAPQDQYSTKIINLRREGLSVQEIAEYLRIPQGEVNLKINLYAKHKTGLLDKSKQNPYL